MHDIGTVSQSENIASGVYGICSGPFGMSETHSLVFVNVCHLFYKENGEVIQEQYVHLNEVFSARYLNTRWVYWA